MSTFERRLISGRRYFLSDLRLVAGGAELALDDVGDVQRTQTGLQQVLGLSTLHVASKDPRRPSLVLTNVRRGTQLAALIELFASDPRTRVPETVSATMSWEPSVSTPGKRETLTAIALIIVSVAA